MPYIERQSSHDGNSFSARRQRALAQGTEIGPDGRNRFKRTQPFYHKERVVDRFTLRSLGADFQEPPGFAILDTPLESLGSVDTGKAVIVAARFTKPWDGATTYGVLTYLIHQSLASQGIPGTLDDWRNPQFVQPHKNLNPEKWRILLKQLQPFIEVVEGNERGDVVNEAIPYLLSGESYHHFIDKIRNRIFGSRFRMTSQIYYSAGLDLRDHSFSFGRHANIVGAFNTFIGGHGYAILQPAISTLIGEGSIPDSAPPEQRVPDASVAKDGSGDELRLNLDQLYKFKRLIEKGHPIAVRAHAALVRQFILSLGNTPGQRALNIARIRFLGQPHRYEPFGDDDYRLEDVDEGREYTMKETFNGDHNPYSPTHVFRIEYGTLVYTRSYGNYAETRRDTLAYNLWLDDEAPLDTLLDKQRPYMQVRPVIALEIPKNGAPPTMVYDMRELTRYFPHLGEQQERTIVNSPLAGFAAFVYAQPQVHRLLFPERMSFKQKDMKGRDPQAIREGQVLFAAMMWENRFTTTDFARVFVNQ